MPTPLNQQFQEELALLEGPALQSPAVALQALVTLLSAVLTRLDRQQSELEQLQAALETLAQLPDQPPARPTTPAPPEVD